MAKKEGQRGWKSYVPSVHRIVQVLIVLVVLKLVLRYATNNVALPGNVMNLIPVL